MYAILPLFTVHPIFMKKAFHVVGVIIVIAAIAVLLQNSSTMRPYSTPGSSGVSRGLSDTFQNAELGMGIAAKQYATAPTEAPSISPVPPSGDEVGQKDRMIVRNGSMSLVVKNVSSLVDEIRVYVEGQGGFLVTSSLNEQSSNPSATLTLRVPVDHYGPTYDWVKSKAEKIVSETSSGQDVTEEYVDLDSRLRNLRASEQQFLEIMKRSGQISDVLAVQQQLERIRGEIEQTVGRQKYLSQSAKLATLTLYLSTEEKELPIVNPQQKWEPLAVIKAAFRSLAGFGESLGNTIIWLAIYSIVWIPALLIWFWWRRRRNRMMPPQQ